MPLGGGTFSVPNDQILPGSYINVVSARRAEGAVSARGAAAMPLGLDWGPELTMLTVTRDEFERNCLRLFGHPADSDKMTGLRELFRHADTLHYMRINAGGANASSALARAAYSGPAGNELRVSVEAGSAPNMVVTTLFHNAAVDRQTVASSADLTDNGFVLFTKTQDIQPGESYVLSGGSNGMTAADNYNVFYKAAETVNFQALGVPATVDGIKRGAVDFTRRMREDFGVKFQCALQNYAADYEGVVSSVCAASGPGFSGAASLVYWVTGAMASAGIGKSLLNMVYDGELEIVCAESLQELKDALAAGSFIFHRVGDKVRVLEDINTLVTVSPDKNADFRENQTIRVLDQIASDTAAIFNSRYIGQVQNDASGRISLWSDLVTHRRALEQAGAIENFAPEDISVDAGSSKKSVIVRDRVTPTGAMAQLYMTLVVS